MTCCFCLENNAKGICEQCNCEAHFSCLDTYLKTGECVCPVCKINIKNIGVTTRSGCFAEMLLGLNKLLKKFEEESSGEHFEKILLEVKRLRDEGNLYKFKDMTLEEYIVETMTLFPNTVKVFEKVFPHGIKLR